MGFLLPFIFTSLFAWAGPKEDTLKALGKFAYEVDYFGEESFRRLSLDSGEVDRLRKEPGYRETYQRYLAYGAKAQIEEKLTRAPASVPSVTDKAEAFVFPVSQNLGLIAFKRGDLKAACPKVVQAAKALGADRIAYYHPVHFSGGNSKNYRMPERPEYGVHYRYEVANNFSQQEFEQCLDLVAAAKLKLHYVPHLESIAALVGAEEEWRMLSGIPVDDWYFHHAFGPLLTYLKKRPANFRTPGAIDFTLAAEIDPMVIVHARKVRAGKAWLETKLSELGYRGGKYYINTNGDFHHGKDFLSGKNLQCEEVTKLFSEIDALTPSMYGDKGHLRKSGGKLDLKLTLDAYRGSFRDHLQTLCPAEKKDIERVAASVKLGFGEFAVDETDKEQSYRDILKEADQSLIFVQYWNHGKWDHLGVLGEKVPAIRKELVTEKARTTK